MKLVAHTEISLAKKIDLGYILKLQTYEQIAQLINVIYDRDYKYERMLILVKRHSKIAVLIERMESVMAEF
jgi:hypothetical protein